MRPSDLVKATVVCAGIAYVFYSYPVVSQVVTIAVIGLVWSSYLYRTLKNRRCA
jgi:uncharacterized membrane protein YesL